MSKETDRLVIGSGQLSGGMSEINCLMSLENREGL